MTLHRIPRKQLDPDIFYVYDDMGRIVGLDRTTAQVHAHLHDDGEVQAYHKASNTTFDPIGNPLTSANVQFALAEFANKQIAEPVQETSAAPVATPLFHVGAASEAYVGVTGEDPNAAFAIYNTDGHELDIQVLDITSDAAGTTSVAGNIWHSNPYLQLSAIPGEEILVKYGTRTSLGDLPINALLKEGVIAAEVDSEVIEAIADIKGTAWHVPVAADSNIVMLDYRIDNLEDRSHIHKTGIAPVGVMDGVNRVFTLPGAEGYVLGSLAVYLSGIRLRKTLITEIDNATFQLDIFTEQLPDSTMGDWLNVDYILLEP